MRQIKKLKTLDVFPLEADFATLLLPSVNQDNNAENATRHQRKTEVLKKFFSNQTKTIFWQVLYSYFYIVFFWSNLEIQPTSYHQLEFLLLSFLSKMYLDLNLLEIVYDLTYDPIMIFSSGHIFSE